MIVSNLITRDTPTVSESASIVDVAREMRTLHSEALVVMNGKKPVGIVTERDLVAGILALDLSPAGITAGDLVTQHPLILNPNEDGDAAVRRMRGAGVRHAVVTKPNGELRGLFSLDDYMEHLADSLREVSILIAQERRAAEKTHISRN